MNPDEMARHIMRFYDQHDDEEAMTDAIAHAIRQHSKPLEKQASELKEILTDPVNQLEVTKGGYYIYRFDLETMHRIADALGVERNENPPAIASYTPFELTQLIKP